VERLALVSEEQKIWSDAASLFVSVSAAPEDEILQRASLNVLGRIGRDDFALLRLSPPLIYHNDMTASVKRYYWSEDFGYALWLRLYEAATANPRAHPNPRP
jgi:hypothetical protein